MSIDGVEGNIADHCKGLYSNLYNSVNDKNESRILEREINERITFEQLYEVNEVTPDILKKSASNLSFCLCLCVPY